MEGTSPERALLSRYSSLKAVMLVVEAELSNQPGMLPTIRGMLFTLEQPWKDISSCLQATTDNILCNSTCQLVVAQVQAHKAGHRAPAWREGSNKAKGVQEQGQQFNQRFGYAAAYDLTTNSVLPDAVHAVSHLGAVCL